MSEIVHCIPADMQIGIWVECPSCGEQVDIIKAFALGKKPVDFNVLFKEQILFLEILKGFPSPQLHTPTIICALDIKCPDCEYAMRITSLELEEGY